MVLTVQNVLRSRTSQQHKNSKVQRIIVRLSFFYIKGKYLHLVTRDVAQKNSLFYLMAFMMFISTLLIFAAVLIAA